jgi:hypothetical protein
MDYRSRVSRQLDFTVGVPDERRRGGFLQVRDFPL